jgi:hypothetical protein
VDVGYGQLAWSLRSDSRVRVIERTNVRELTPDAIGGAVDLVVADLSFISLSTVLPALTACAAPHADIVPMVKPQFEVGRSQVGTGGVVTDPQLRADAVLAVARRAAELGWHTVAATASPLPGPSGNVEYFLRLRAQTDGHGRQKRRQKRDQREELLDDEDVLAEGKTLVQRHAAGQHQDQGQLPGGRRHLALQVRRRAVSASLRPWLYDDASESRRA